MAKKEKVNKSKAVRDFMAANPKAAPKEVSEALTKQGVKVSPAHVSNIKNKMGKRKHRGKAAKVLSEKTGIGVPEIKAAFMLLKQCGSIKGVKEALTAALEIQKVL
jgi:hypothetical protein